MLLLSLATLLLAETSLRLYDHFNPLFIFYDPSYQRFRGQPRAQGWHFRLNSGGFQDVEFTEKEPGRYRIVAIGDSFAFGVVPYQHNYLTLLENLLDDTGNRTEILNMGIPSLGPKEYLSVIVHEALPLKPDLILLSFFVGNDFFESARDTAVKRRLHTYSYLASLLHYFISVKRHYQGFALGPEEAPYDDDGPSFDREAFLRIEAERIFIFVADDPHFRRFLADAVHYLSEIDDLCKQQRIELLVVIIPDEAQVNADLARELKRRFLPKELEPRWNIEQPNDELTAELRAMGIKYIDLLDSFAERGKSQRLYRPQNTHWNIAGNRLAARIIFESWKRSPPADWSD